MYWHNIFISLHKLQLSFFMEPVELPLLAHIHRTNVWSDYPLQVFVSLEMMEKFNLWYWLSDFCGCVSRWVLGFSERFCKIMFTSVKRTEKVILGSCLFIYIDIINSIYCPETSPGGDFSGQIVRKEQSVCPDCVSLQWITWRYC